MNLLLRYRGFRWLWLGQLLSQMGNAVFLIMGLWEIQLRSPFLLSIAGLAMVVPSLLSAAGGVFVDRHDPRRLMLWTDLLRGAAVALGTAALLLPGSLVTVVIVLLGINSLGASIFGPAESVMVPRLVADEDLPAANGVYSLTVQISSALGAALGGAAIAAIGVRVVFGLDMGSFWLSALAIGLMMRTVTARPRNAAAAAQDDGSTSFLASMRGGLAAVRELPAMMQLMPLFVLVNFAFTAAFTMLPYWIHHALHANALSYGFIDAGWAAGLIIGSLGTGYFQRVPIRVSSTLAFGLMSVLFGAFALSGSAVGSGALLLAAGIGNGIGNALLFTLLQRLIPESVRGRAFGLLMTLLGLANPLGTLAAGALLHLIPLYWYWLFSAVTGIAMAVGLWFGVPGDLSPATAVETEILG